MWLRQSRPRLAYRQQVPASYKCHSTALSHCAVLLRHMGRGGICTFFFSFFSTLFALSPSLSLSLPPSSSHHTGRCLAAYKFLNTLPVSPCSLHWSSQTTVSASLCPGKFMKIILNSYLSVPRVVSRAFLSCTSLDRKLQIYEEEWRLFTSAAVCALCKAATVAVKV